MEITPIEAELELKHDAVLAECPVWDEHENLLYWVDIAAGRLYRYDPVQQTNSGFEIGEEVGSFALRESGGFVLALESGFAFYETETRRMQPIADPESGRTNCRFNDGKCDPGGRFWAGTLSRELRKGAGSLYCLNTDLSIDIKQRNLTIPNGMAWDTDTGNFYFIDSPEQRIVSFAYDMVSGSLGERSTVWEIEGDALPDGMTIDSEGKLWVALYNGSRVVRVDPATGESAGEIVLPVPRVTSCTFGGTGLDELYITTAREHMSEEELERYPLSGSLFRAELPVGGNPAVRFAG